MTEAELLTRRDSLKPLLAPAVSLVDLRIKRVELAAPEAGGHLLVHVAADYAVGPAGCLGRVQSRPLYPARRDRGERHQAGSVVPTAEDLLCIDWNQAATERLGAPCVAVANAWSEACGPQLYCMDGGADVEPGKSGRCGAPLMLRAGRTFSVEGTARFRPGEGEWGEPAVSVVGPLEPTLRPLSEPLEAVVEASRRELLASGDVIKGAGGAVLVVGALELEGPLTAAAAEKMVKKGSRALLKCYERQLLRDAGLRGRVSLQLLVWDEDTTPLGGGGRIEVDGHTGGDSAVEAANHGNLKACLFGAARSWQVPRFKGGTTLLTVPLRFDRLAAPR